MTAFILVSGTFTGAHVWEDAAARLAAAGAEVHTPDLTGLGAGSGPARPGTDLETHIVDVLAAIDSVDAAAGREIVLVGHDYGIHPVLGAADRRAERVSRIVYLDAGMPQDGVPALAAVPDQTLREQLAERAARGGAAGELPPPARDEWQRWGSTAGIPEEALDRLTARAAPQPLGTLLQPLRLTGAVAAVPVTGVLCTGNGAGIEMLQIRVSFGDPAFEALTDPRVTFFELPTGHWPMLSCPEELAEVLLRAAAGEGHRLKPAGTTEPPPHLRPFLLDLPEPARERTGNVDLYLPAAEGPRPAVVFVHGGPVPAEARPTPREWPTLTGYARYAAGQGVVGVTFDHRLHDVTDYERSAADTTARWSCGPGDPRVDPDRGGTVVLLGRRPDGGGLAGGAPGVAALPGGQLPDHGAAAELGAARGTVPPGGRGGGRGRPAPRAHPGRARDARDRRHRRGVPGRGRGLRSRRGGDRRAERPPQLRGAGPDRRVARGRAPRDALGAGTPDGLRRAAPTGPRRTLGGTGRVLRAPRTPRPGRGCVQREGEGPGRSDVAPIGPDRPVTERSARRGRGRGPRGSVPACADRTRETAGGRAAERVRGPGRSRRNAVLRARPLPYWAGGREAGNAHGGRAAGARPPAP